MCTKVLWPAESAITTMESLWQNWLILILNKWLTAQQTSLPSALQAISLSCKKILPFFLCNVSCWTLSSSDRWGCVWKPQPENWICNTLRHLRSRFGQSWHFFSCTDCLEFLRKLHRGQQHLQTSRVWNLANLWFIFAKAWHPNKDRNQIV